MTNIKSNHTSPLGLPGGPIIPPGGTVSVERWRFIKNSYAVQAWLAAKVIEEVGNEERATAPVQPAPVLKGTAGDPTADLPKTAAEVLAMADKVHFQTFKAEAVKVLGDDAPSKKEELIAALEERATAPV